MTVTILLMIIIKQTGLANIDCHLWDYEPTGEVFQYNGTTYDVKHAVYNPRFYFAILGGWLIIAAHYWASFKLFCRMQVINNKWLNV